MTTRDKVNGAFAILYGLLLVTIPFILIGVLTRHLAIKKGRRPWLWFWLGATINPLIIVPVALLVGKKTEQPTEGEWARKWAESAKP
jgi:hypothetical protein